MASQIGFTAQRNDKPQSAVDPKEFLYQFDSGTGLTLTDLNHHLLVLGTTGCGKTASCATSILASFIQRGCPGLVIDIKGNVLSKVRAMAAAAGRLGDVVEFGSSPTATPINFLANLTRSGVNAFFENLTRRSFGGQTGNMDFHMKGIKQATDCAQLLDILHDIDPAFERNAQTVGEIIANPRLALKFYDLFKAKVFDPENPDHVHFAEEVECDRFHTLFDGKTARERKGSFERVDSTRNEQMNYALQGIRVALNRFLDSRGVAENFSASGAPGLDMAQLLAKRKIVVLRFGADSGPVEEDICRMFIQDYYKSVYDIGMALPTHSFMIVDEYQNICDLSDNRLSDQRFVAMSREYKSCVVLLTQSMSAMIGGANDAAGVESLIANCNSRIIFYSDDPLTQEMARRYGEIDLTMLKPQEAFVIRYEAASRKHVQSFETVNNAYQAGLKALEAGKGLVGPLEIQEREKRKSLRELIEIMEAKERKMCDTETEILPSLGCSGIPGATGDEPQQLPEEQPKKAAMPDVRRAQGRHDELIAKFPNVFSIDAEIDLLTGWRPFVAGALAAVQACGLEIRLTSLEIIEGYLQGRNDNAQYGRSPSLYYFNSLLLETVSICGICGDAVSDNSHSRRKSLPLCEECRKKYGLWHERENAAGMPPAEWTMDD